ncbi:MAG: ribosomal protein L11 methyltransferase [Gammaproteobacteria bacterium]|jgi:ribosomal protein L11 methyltransferase
MSWLQVSVPCTSEDADRIAQRLEGLGAAAVSFIDQEDVPVLEPPPGTAVLWAKTVVQGLFESPGDGSDLGQRVNEALADLSLSAPVVEPLAERDWVREGQKGFAPREFGDGLWIVPHDQEPPREARAAVHLDPGVAFGTGSHPTTALCLDWLSYQETDGHRKVSGTVLDYGCGSGILGVAACKLGARRVIMIDNDPQAVAASRLNAARNGVQDNVQAALPAGLEALLGTRASVDTLVANILLEPLLDLAPLLLHHLRPAAALCLSGILDAQIEALTRAYSPWLRSIEHSSLDGWARVSGVRNDDPVPNDRSEDGPGAGSTHLTNKL